MLVEQPDDDIAADIRAAIDSGAPAAPEPAAAEAPISESTPGAPVDPAAQQTSQENDGRVRDEHGRFVKKEGVANTPESAQPETASPQAAAEPPSETIRPPASWSATAKSQFATLPEVIQKEILKREGDIEQGKAQWDAKGERLNRFEALLAPHREKFAVQGLDEFTAINALLNAQAMLERNPNEAIAYLARQYGAQVPPSGPQAPAQGFQQAQPQADPHLLHLAQQVQSLQQALQQQQEARSAEEMSRVQSDVEAFRKDNLYFDNVKATMGKLIESGLATGLQDAYDQACYANPEIRSLLIAAQAPKPQSLAPSQSGTPAGLSVTGSPGLGRQPSPVDPNSSIEDDVRSAFAQVVGRV